METIAVESSELSLSDLAARVEQGERIVLTRGGRPVADLVPRARKGGVNF